MEHSGGADDGIGSPNYWLWQPVCCRSADGVVCSFDVTSPDFRGINEGDAGLFAGFLEALDVCAGRVESWTVRRFASPFYALDPEDADWRDRFGVVWRISLLVSDVTRYRECGGFGPHAANGLDPTWTDGPDGIVREEEDCVLIASEGPSKEFAFLAESPAGGELALVEYKYLHMAVTQARLSFGSVNLPHLAEPIRGLLRQAQVRFMTTHWTDAYERSAWKNPSEWTTVD